MDLNEYYNLWRKDQTSRNPFDVKTYKDWADCEWALHRIFWCSAGLAGKIPNWYVYERLVNYLIESLRLIRLRKWHLPGKDCNPWLPFQLNMIHDNHWPRVSSFKSNLTLTSNHPYDF